MGKPERLPQDIEHVSMSAQDLSWADVTDQDIVGTFDIDSLKGSEVTIINGGDLPDAIKFHDKDGKIIPFAEAEIDLSANEGTFAIKILKRVKEASDNHHGKEIAAFTVAAVLVGVGTRYVSKRRKK